MVQVRALVLGASGLLGSNVTRTFLDVGVETVGTFHSTEPSFDARLERVDVTESDAVENLLDDVEPTVVVNCTAMVDVDACERQPERAERVNATAVENVADHCNQRGVELVHVSTDYVFSGEQSERYVEDDRPRPVQVYGQTKLAGDRAVLDAHRRPVIVRPAFIYGIHGATGDLSGFPAWVREKVRDGGDVPLFTDQHVTPSRAGQVATTIRELVERGETGVFHVASRSRVTPFEFGELLAETLDEPTERLRPASMADVDRLARRPTSTGLAVDAIDTALGRRQPTLAEDIEAISTAC